MCTECRPRWTPPRLAQCTHGLLGGCVYRVWVSLYGDRCANQVSRDILIITPVMDRDNGEEPGNKTRGQVRTAEIDQYWL